MLGQMNCNLLHIAAAPGRRTVAQPGGDGNGQGGGGGGRGQPKPANLSNCPRTLYDLLAEYSRGLGGCKAARNFNQSER